MRDMRRTFEQDNLGLTALYIKRDEPARRPDLPIARPRSDVDLMGSLVASRYRLEHQIGTGAFATVWSAWDLSLTRRVAVKVYSGAESICADEAQLQGTCQHPGLMPLFDAGTDPSLDVSFIVMPLFPGADLAATVERYGQLPFGTVLACADHICSALEFLWNRRQIVHGDVKPSNIWLTSGGNALLMDFNLPGILVRSGVVTAGTPGFTSPEALRGRRDQRSDVFSLGCVVYQSLSGVAPFADDAAAEKGRYVPLHKLRTDIWPELEAVIHTALEPDPGRRYQSAREFQSALRRPGRAHGISWPIAIGLGIVGCASHVLRYACWCYGTTWRLLTRFIRHARRRPWQAFFEACFIWLAWRIASQAAACWVHTHLFLVQTLVIGVPALLIGGSAIAAKQRGHTTGRRRRRQ